MEILNTILFKNTMTSVFDYAFIILSCSIQRLNTSLQKTQNMILKMTTASEIFNFLKFKPVEMRYSDLLKKFGISKSEHELIVHGSQKRKISTNDTANKYINPFDTIISYLHHLNPNLNLQIHDNEKELNHALMSSSLDDIVK